MILNLDIHRFFNDIKQKDRKFNIKIYEKIHRDYLFSLTSH
jgi:hypothetical protein